MSIVSKCLQAMKENIEYDVPTLTTLTRASESSVAYAMRELVKGGGSRTNIRG